MKLKSVLFSLLIIISLSTNAQITTDGTLGQALNLPGPDYQISANLGQQHGGNLFHSFQDFNLQSFEMATFSGPTHIQNVISRVTGGNPSHLDGLFRSTIENADVYLLNPYGIIFGPNARLDVQGSFHASTADYLRLGKEGRFDVRNPSDSILTVAPIEAFGFLTDSPAKITTQSSKLIVPTDKTLSLIGGDLHLTSDTPLTTDNTLLIPPVKSESILVAEHGRVNLASLASIGEVALTENGVKAQGSGGQIELDNTLIEISGYGGGAVFIRAARFLLDNSIIRSNTLGNVNGKNINLLLTQAAYLNGLNSEISVTSMSQNNSGDILIEIPHLEMTGAIINTASGLNGHAGNVEINAQNIFLKGGAYIFSGSQNFGHSGDIKLNVKETLSLTGFAPGYRINHSFEFENASSTIFSISTGAGHGGNIFIDSKNLNLVLGTITTSNFGVGQGGNIDIHAQQTSLLNGGIISSATHTKGQAGNINLNVAEQLYIAGQTLLSQLALGARWEQSVSQVESASFGEASGGTINIQANHITAIEDGLITAKSHAIGNAGDIFIQTNHLQVMDNGEISTSADHAFGGSINLTIPNLLYLKKGVITSSAGGGGDGGNITIENPQFTVLNQAQIKAQADAGRGGHIRITAEHFIKSYESLVSASSRLGLDGKVEIDSPDESVTEGILTLSSETVDASRMMEKTCEARNIKAYKNRSRFIINPIAGSPASPFDLQPSRLSQPPIKINPTDQQPNQNLMTHHPHQLRLSMTCQPASIDPVETSAVIEPKKVIPEQLF